MPDSDPARRFYQGSAGKQYHEIKRGVPEQALPWVLNSRAQKFSRHIKSSDVVFEYGVGAGWNLAQLQCAQKIGFDVADHLTERVQALGIKFVSDLATIPDKTADVVLCHQTLEHLSDPFKALNQLLRIARPGGHLILHVPWERERRYSQYNPQEPNHHLYNWNAQNIGNLVTLTGFQINTVQVLTYGYDRFAAVLALKMKMGAPGYRLLRRILILLRPLYEIELIAEKPIE